MGITLKPVAKEQITKLPLVTQFRKYVTTFQDTESRGFRAAWLGRSFLSSVGVMPVTFLN